MAGCDGERRNAQLVSNRNDLVSGAEWAFGSSNWNDLCFN